MFVVKDSKGRLQAILVHYSHLVIYLESNKNKQLLWQDRPDLDETLLPVVNVPSVDGSDDEWIIR